jgi:hypothetical protein
MQILFLLETQQQLRLPWQKRQLYSTYLISFLLTDYSYVPGSYKTQECIHHSTSAEPV